MVMSAAVVAVVRGTKSLNEADDVNGCQDGLLSDDPFLNLSDIPGVEFYGAPAWSRAQRIYKISKGRPGVNDYLGERGAVLFQNVYNGARFEKP